MAQKTTAEIVFEALSKSSNTEGYQYDQRLINDLAAVLEDPSYRVRENDKSSSIAADYVRVALRFSYGDHEEASRVTCNIFYTLARQMELGWIEEQVPGYYFTC